MNKERERWFAFSGVLLGVGLAFAIVDLVLLVRISAGIEGAPLRIFFGIGVIVTGLSVTASMFIRMLKLRT
jgi:hypothetical protein